MKKRLLPALAIIFLATVTTAHAKYEIESHVDIEATPEQVWAVVSDIAAFDQWNPFIHYAHGTLAKGNFIDVLVQPSGAKPTKGKGKVLVLEPPRRMVWAATLGGSWIFRGEHHFEVEALPGGTARFVQNEYFTGILVPLLRGKLNRETRHGFDEMNAALKSRVEALKAGQQK